MVDQIFLSPQVKRSVIISNKLQSLAKVCRQTQKIKQIFLLNVFS